MHWFLFYFIHIASGTDATHAEHIEKVKQRQYAGLENNHFLPGKIGLGLVEGYDTMGFEMSKPNLRAQLEADLKGWVIFLFDQFCLYHFGRWQPRQHATHESFIQL